MTDLAQGTLGSIGKYDVAFSGGSLVVTLDANAFGVGSAGLVVKVDSGLLLDVVKKAIPGTVDDMVIDLIKAALLKV